MTVGLARGGARKRGDGRGEEFVCAALGGKLSSKQSHLATTPRANRVGTRHAHTSGLETSRCLKLVIKFY